MLTDEERQEILDETRLYPHPQAACIDALMIVQRHRGWVSDETVHDVAAILNMHDNEVDSVASFYTRIYRRPTGRNIILVCDSVSCMIMGYESVYDHISEKLGIRFGETTPDGKFTLLPVTCLGVCDHAPAIMINNDLFIDVTTGRIDELLQHYD
jgi:NADH-quinone oxidoreductase subunit E